MRWPRREWRIVCDRGGDPLAGERFWTEKQARRQAAHLTILSSCRFTESMARLIGEPLRFVAVRVSRG